MMSPSAASTLTPAHAFSLCPPPPACRRLPASTDPNIFAAQRTMVEAWTIVGESFVDPTFNGHNWEEELRAHMMAAFNAPTGDAAYAEISHMLEDLGDVYTRRIPPE